MPLSQRGVVLIAGLLMVVLLTVIALAAIRGSGLQESMAFNMRDTTVAFQSAESSLRSCEFRLRPAAGAAPQVNCTAGGGVCNDLNLIPANSINNDPVFWLNVAQNMNTALGLPNIPDVAQQPRCLIEIIPVNIPQCNFLMLNSTQVGTNPPNCRTSYRVTAQGVGAEITTQVVLQSTYAK